MFDPTALSNLLAEYLPASRIEDLELPFVAIATDVYLPVPESIPTTIFDFESTAVLAKESYVQGRIVLAALAELGTRSELLDAGLYGTPPPAVLNPEIDALRRIRPIPTT